MPLTKKGSQIMKNMVKEYGKKKGKSVFYASKNKGTIKGVEPEISSYPTSTRSRRPIYGE